MRKIIEIIVDRRYVVLFIGLGIGAFGFYAYRNMPLDAIPDVAPPMVQIFTEAPGLSAEEVERFITYPLELSLMGLPNVVKVRSVSNFGLSSITIYFKDGTDIYWARQVVGERLQEAKEKLLFGEPQMGPISTSTGLVLFYFLKDTTGKYSLYDLRTIQDWIVKPLLMTVPGVNEVLSIGGFVKQYHVLVDPYRLKLYNVTLKDVVEKLENNNSNVGGQFIVKNSQEVVVRSVGMLNGVDDISRVLLKSENGVPVFIRDVADVRIGGEIRRGLQTMDGEGEVVAGMVIKLYGTNSSKVISEVEKKIREINTVLPPGIKIVPYYEQKSLVKAVVNTVLSALGMGVILVVLILTLFLRDIRISLSVILSLPFSLLFAVILMKHFNVSINLMSVGGLAIALGILVDATIVVIENIQRYRERYPGKSRKEIVVEAASEVIGPVLVALTITVLTFVPLMTLQGVEGRMFKPLLFAVLSALSGSILYAFLISPAVAYISLPSKIKSPKIPYRTLRLALRTFYWAHKRPVLMGITYILLLIISVVAIRFVGSEFIPELREGTLVVRTALHPAVSLDESKRMALLIERKIKEVPGVKYVTSRVGRGEVGAHTDPINNIETYIILEKGVKQEDVERKIRKNLESIPGAMFNFTQPIKMTTDELLEGARGDIVIKIFGEDLETLQRLADKLAGKLKDVPGLTDVRAERLEGTPRLRISVKREWAAKYGLDVAEISRLVEKGIGGSAVGSVYEGVRRWDIFVRLKEEYRDNAEAIKHLPVFGHNGVIVPLDEVAYIEEVVGPRQITRENFHRFATVTANVDGRDVGSVVKDIEKVVSSINLPPGYVVDIGGQYELQREATRRFAMVVPVVLLIIIVLIFFTLNDVRMTFLVLLNMPVAVSGGILALLFTGENFSVPASIGFISLLGIATEVSIILMDYVRKLKGKVSRATVLRLRAVSMTVMTTALGLLPLVFSTGPGSEVQRPLAIVVLGGLTTLILATLFVMPALYQLVSKLGGRN